MTLNQDSNCIFCKLVAKQLPATVVYEDRDTLALVMARR